MAELELALAANVVPMSLNSQLGADTDVDALVSGVFRCSVNLMGALVGSPQQGILEVYVGGSRGIQRLNEIGPVPRVWQRTLTSSGWNGWVEVGS